MPAIRVPALALAACDTGTWIYSFPFVLAHTDPKGTGFDMLPVTPFTLIFFALTLSSVGRAIRGHGLNVALALLLGATMLNVIILALVSSNAAASR